MLTYRVRKRITQGTTESKPQTIKFQPDNNQWHVPNGITLWGIDLNLDT